MIPDLDPAVVEAQQLHPSVVPKVHHDRDAVVGLALEPHRQVGLPSIFARQGEGTVAVDEVLSHIWIHEVLAHQSASTGHLHAVSVTLSLIERASKASRQWRIKLICKRNLVLRDFALATTPDGAHELVRGKAKWRLLHLHLENPSRQQGDEDKERWKQHLRSPGTPVAAHRESTLSEDGIELLKPEDGPRLQFSALMSCLLSRRLGALLYNCRGSLGVRIWVDQSCRWRLLVCRPGDAYAALLWVAGHLRSRTGHALWRLRLILVPRCSGRHLRLPVGDRQPKDHRSSTDALPSFGRMVLWVSLDHCTCRRLAGIEGQRWPAGITASGQRSWIEGQVAHLSVKALLMDARGLQEDLLHGRRAETIGVDLELASDGLVLKLQEELWKLTAAAEGQSEAELATPGPSKGRPGDGAEHEAGNSLAVAAVVADHGEHVAFSEVPL
mmetsp:Transcript_5828/g.13678  ORF Transcript_5828/g.13678 Transcript_5828/m.13678 type:complete len:442 (+) Transcript_5828:358-1683(+)